MNLKRYIGFEAGFGVISHIFHAVTRKSREEPLERKDLKIGDLIKTAEDHRWVDTSL